MQVKENQVTQIKITDVKGLDPITVYIDERKDNEYQGCCPDDVRYQGRIVILCYGVALNYFWGAMGAPMCEFFCTASTGYILGKFEQNARETYRPRALTGHYNENGKLVVQDLEASFEMEEHHKKYICKIIEAVKEAFSLQLKEEQCKI